MAKKQAIQERNIKETSFGISKQIDVNFRNYALYVLENRGIPSFYDSLTNVQRVSLMNAPKTFSKTISLVGASISSGYHHGDCLKYDTVIHLYDGNTITIGEWTEKYPDAQLALLSYDEKTGKLVSELGYAPRIGHVTNELYDIYMADGSVETCTGNHPWFTQRGWVKAEDLLEDDEILSYTLTYIKQKTSKRVLDEPVPMYDITVNRTACFFVGKSKTLTHNTSLSGAINKLARPFGCAESLLLGDGYFGTPVNPEASATRYTSIKINPVINEIIGKYMMLNKKNDDDQWEWLRTEIPIGLLTTIVGIAVGYKSTVLPRKLEEIQKFLDGKKANLNPYFKGFNGKISGYNGLRKTWIIESVVEINENEKSIRITELPPLMKYSSFIKKLGKYAESDVDFSILNDSSDEVDITLKYKSGDSWENFKDKISKMLKILVTESLTYVKDSSVIEYNEISDYLSEYRVHRENVRLDKSVYDISVYDFELESLKAKIEYLKFMLAKKRADPEIETFLSSYMPKIKSRLERILLKELSPEALKKTELQAKEMEKTLKTELETKASLEKSLEKLKVDTPIYSKSTKNNRSVDLFINDTDEIDGIEIFSSEVEEELEEEL